jgi:hypothetical protein
MHSSADFTDEEAAPLPIREIRTTIARSFVVLRKFLPQK